MEERNLTIKQKEPLMFFFNRDIVVRLENFDWKPVPTFETDDVFTQFEIDFFNIF